MGFCHENKNRSIAFYLLFRSEKQVSESYLKSLLTEREQQKKDKLLEQLKEEPMDISEPTPDEIELIKIKRAAESWSSAQGHQERSINDFDYIVDAFMSPGNLR